MFEHLFADVKFALRWLRRSPGFTAVAILSLAIGIGFNTALFTLVDAVLFRPLPVDRPDPDWSAVDGVAPKSPWHENRALRH